MRQHAPSAPGLGRRETFLPPLEPSPRGATGSLLCEIGSVLVTRRGREVTQEGLVAAGKGRAGPGVPPDVADGVGPCKGDVAKRPQRAPSQRQAKCGRRQWSALSPAPNHRTTVRGQVGIDGGIGGCARGLDGGGVAGPLCAGPYWRPLDGAGSVQEVGMLSGSVVTTISQVSDGRVPVVTPRQSH